MEGLIIDAQRSGELAEMPPRKIAVLLSAVIDGLSIYALLYPDRFGKAELVEFLDDFFDALKPGGIEAVTKTLAAAADGSRPRAVSRRRK
jgi:predicted methyltransferase